ncbi:tRNA/rRNA methyltransferase (SpoU) [Desulfobulbus propionicus DSM 2032]|uniref:tRNA/rRNA methyltransferase (SpoU) n=1 Tax=Desulfobulbus propionicus (strain ATCC 33891 / DSM 2032 / VKM B-1956 / 1pr3) TaxID=577650 RepID=A0A7U3YNY1_DESPD|nr:RNA methyltransferase [Desulfobulbus propionicus]ADW18728.1 tRNA/rRNA methyltransferase (SpoU) [Desulfobulbus propionicus DSM 2032]
MSSTPMPDGRLGQTGIILVGPKFPENIGASARIASNFGIAELIVVSEEDFDQERMLKMATHKAAHLIHGMRVCRTTAEAAAPFHFIVGTTARQGRHRPQDQTPREVMAEIVPLLAGNRVGLMFGPEDSGLSNEDLDLCQFASTIPTAGFSSLNLAQAVAIHCYELYTAVHTHPFAAIPTSEFANSFDLEGMYEHIEQALNEITFLHDTNRVYWMRNIRQFLSRLRLKKKEASMIRGICRKLMWHHRQPPQTDMEQDRSNGKAAQ